MLEIKEVKSKRDLKRFIGFQYKLYQDNPYWVPPLISDEIDTLDMTKNAASYVSETKYWMAYQNGEIVGRIAAIFNKNHFKRWGKNQMRFGWFDFINDIEVADKLLQKVEEWAIEKKMDSVIGPIGFTDMDKTGLLVEGFEEFGTYATLYNYSYYPEILEKLDYKKDVDYIEYKIQIPKSIPAVITKLAARTKRKHNLEVIKFRNQKEIMNYAEKVFDLIMETYRILYGYVDLHEEQVKQYIKKYISYIEPEYVTLIKDNKEDLIGFGITMPSMTKAMQKAKGRLFPFGLFHILKEIKKTNIVDLYLIGVKPDYQGKGVSTIILEEMAKSFISMGCEYAESNPELEKNKNVQGHWRFFEREQHKRRRVFIKELG